MVPSSPHQSQSESGDGQERTAWSRSGAECREHVMGVLCVITFNCQSRLPLLPCLESVERFKYQLSCVSGVPGGCDAGHNAPTPLVTPGHCWGLHHGHHQGHRSHQSHHVSNIVCSICGLVYYEWCDVCAGAGTTLCAPTLARRAQLSFAGISPPAGPQGGHSHCHSPRTSSPSQSVLRPGPYHISVSAQNSVLSSPQTPDIIKVLTQLAVVVSGHTECCVRHIIIRAELQPDNWTVNIWCQGKPDKCHTPPDIEEDF